MAKSKKFHLPDLSGRERAQMLRYAMNVLDAQRLMTTARGKNILHYTLLRKRRHVRMAHYPKGDRIDYHTGAQYFYHCHREDFDREEHGHFHCFLRYKKIPKHIKPTPLPDWDKNIDSPMAHIVAIAMNRYGQPIRLFTVNRWISFETWYDAKHAPEFVKRFKFTLEDSAHWQVLDSWVEGMLHLFAPQIAWINEKRDETIARWQKKHPGSNAYEDHRLEELSEISINLSAQVRWITGS
ncbi:MAG: hypothetical protein KGI29_10505 [Pseudomonadota bacterium]|nr:hypothetical protein [Pseudomonadota bacterium]